MRKGDRKKDKGSGGKMKITEIGREYVKKRQ